MAHQSLSIEYQPVASLNLDPRNPRLHSAKQIQQLANSIEKFGFNVPILVDAQLRVIAGHGRVSACQLLGMAEVPTIRLEHFTESQAQAFTIADNRLTENSKWDDRILGEQLKILSEAEIDFSLEITGFEMGEIEILIENVASTNTGKDDPADAIPDRATGPQVTRLGDCWILGRHRVCCGDARNDSVYSALTQGRFAAMVFTEPTGGVPMDGSVAALGEKSDAVELIDFFTNVATHLARYSVDGALHYICADWRYSGHLLAAVGSFFTEFVNLCIWVNGGSCRDSFYRSQHQLIFVFKSGNREHCKQVQPGKRRRNRTNVWTYPRVNLQSQAGHERRLSRHDPAIKPVELVADAILDGTTRGGSVLDPFLGSGTTLIAAERTGRVCFGIELDPSNVDSIVRRWESFTGKPAILESSGHSFDDIEKRNNGR